MFESLSIARVNVVKNMFVLLNNELFICTQILIKFDFTKKLILSFFRYS